MIVDYHMHLRDPQERLSFTVDAVERFVETAAARGVDEIGFTEHVYYFRQTEGVWTLPYQTERCKHDLDEYVGAVVEAKRQELPVKLGLEVDWWPPHDEAIADALAPYPWDFLLGSVHWLGEESVDSPPGLSHPAPYFAAVSEAAQSRRFDVLSHLDLVKIFGLRTGSEHYDGVVDAISESGVAVEISTAGWRKPVGEVYPAPALLAALRERDVPVTLASDAHVPSLVGEDFGRALDVARDAGYETVTVFEGRVGRQEPLDG
ncbi:MAG: PHP domain-containing protein [Gaiellaceae bacterium]